MLTGRLGKPLSRPPRMTSPCKKKPRNLGRFRGLSSGAEEEIRTPTPLRALDPEPSVSTNSTTSACSLSWPCDRYGSRGLRSRPGVRCRDCMGKPYRFELEKRFQYTLCCVSCQLVFTVQVDPHRKRRCPWHLHPQHSRPSVDVARSSRAEKSILGCGGQRTARCKAREDLQVRRTSCAPQRRRWSSCGTRIRQEDKAGHAAHTHDG